MYTIGNSNSADLENIIETIIIILYKFFIVYFFKEILYGRACKGDSGGPVTISVMFSLS